MACLIDLRAYLCTKTFTRHLQVIESIGRGKRASLLAAAHLLNKLSVSHQFEVPVVEALLARRQSPFQFQENRRP